MKSSRSRSRSKGSRNRSSNNNNNGGNVINRVFDSSGPEGKVRGTPQQIIDKYNQLARDAQLSGDRVATENFQQHAEHYLRLLSEATREIEARREEQERQNRDRQIERDRQAERERERNQQRAQQPAPVQPAPAQPAPDQVDPAFAPQPDTNEGPSDSGLVETPESQPKPKAKRTRKPRPKPEAVASEPPVDSGPAPEAAE